MRVPRTIDPLDATDSWALRVLADGGSIEVRRTFPHERTYKLVKSTGMVYTRHLSAGTIARLLELNLIYPSGLRRVDLDRYSYFPTAKAKRAVQTGRCLPPDENQLTLFDQS